MQIDREAEGQASSIGNSSDGEVQPSSNESLRTKKIIVQLSESIFERLEAATERPGLGKSMVVETALQRFLTPAQGAEGLIRETLDRVSGQMARLEREVAIVAETVALHARYHLTVTRRPCNHPSSGTPACSAKNAVRSWSNRSSAECGLANH